MLVDEFQDTSRAQWELVAQLVRSWGEGLRRRGRRAAAVDLHRRRPQAVDLRLPRRRRRGARRGRGVHRGAAAGRRCRGRRSRSASDRCRRSWRSSTTCSRDRRGEARRRGRDALPVSASSDRFPDRRAMPTVRRRRTPEPTPLGAASSATRVQRRGRARRRRDRPAAVRRDRARSDDRRRAAGAAGRHRHPVPLARQPPRVRDGARAARRARPTSTRGSASSTPTRSRTPSRCCGIWPIRCRICAPRRCCARGSSGCRTLRVARLGAAARRRRFSTPSRRRPSTPLGDEDRRVLDALRAAVPRWLAWVDRLAAVGAARRACCARRRTRTRLRGPRRRQARENLKKLRGMVRRAPEPRLRDARPHRRAPRAAGGRRRVERRDRRASTPSA